MAWSWLKRRKDDVSNHPIEAEILFRRIAENYDLEIFKKDDHSVELSMMLPAQAGLKSEIWLCLQNIDELWFVVEHVTCSMFPFREVKDEFEQILGGLLSGEYKLVLWSHNGDELPFRGEIQRPKGDGWECAYSYGSIRSRPFFPRRRERRRELFIR